MKPKEDGGVRQLNAENAEIRQHKSVNLSLKSVIIQGCRRDEMIITETKKYRTYAKKIICRMYCERCSTLLWATNQPTSHAKTTDHDHNEKVQKNAKNYFLQRNCE